MSGAAGHIPVLAREVIDALQPRDGGRYVDGTFGAGGYTTAMLDRANCQVIAIDRDPDAIAADLRFDAAKNQRLSNDMGWAPTVSGRFTYNWTQNTGFAGKNGIWIAALGEAWDRYKSEGGPVGQAFGLEGGKGKNPISKNLDQLLGERAIARWVWHQVTSKRAQGEQCTIEAGIQEAAEFFNCSDTTIRRAWKRFGQEEKGRPTDRVTT